MKQTRLLWDMPITVEIVDAWAKEKDISEIFQYFEEIDKTFSVFREDSEISQINKNLLPKEKYSQEMTEVLFLCEKTKNESNGYFEISRDGKLDPTGLVKGFALYQASKALKVKGFQNYYLDAGGDIEVSGKNLKGKLWVVGIRNPFNRNENIKAVTLKDKGIATSGTYIRGQHIYNLHNLQQITDLVSLTVIAPNVYEADRFATAAFAMGKAGIEFIASRKELEGYAVDPKGLATFTQGFSQYLLKQ